MKHLILLFVALALAYGVWLLTRPLVRPDQWGVFARHGLRLAVLAALLLALLVLAYFSPSTKLL